MKFIYNFLPNTKQCNCALHPIPEKKKQKPKKTKTKDRNEPYQNNFKILR